jgi:AcrR family transcriptional regulator
MMSTDTKQRLLEGAIKAVRVHGIAGVSARTIAAAAGVNQALVFYHFGSVDELLAAACTANTAARVDAYAERFARVGSLGELLDLGRALHVEERRAGNVFVLAQLFAGAQSDPRLGPPVAAALQLWIDQIESVLHRLLAESPFAEVADIPGLARAVSAAFIGLELFEGVDETAARHALDALGQLTVLIEVVDELGPIARRALRAKLTRASTRQAQKAVGSRGA